MQRRRRVVSVCEVRKPRWYRAGNESFEFHALTALRRAPLGSHVWKARTKIKQQLLQSGLHGLLQRPPFVDGNKYSGLHSAAGNDLRTFLEGGVEELREARFCVLQLQRSHDCALPLV